MTILPPSARTVELTRPLAYFDLETTGVDIATDRIVEVAVLKLLPNGTEVTFESRINPGMPIPPSASAVHGIHDKDVEDKPEFLEIAEALATFLEGCDLAGFNVIKFDLPMLKAEFDRAGIDWSEDNRNLVDAHVVYQEKERRDLSTAMKFYCNAEHLEAHSALADVRATRMVLEAQVVRYQDLPHTVDGLSAFCREARPNRYADTGYWFVFREGVLTFNKGTKHKGEPLDVVAHTDPEFLKWMLGLEDLPKDTERIVRRVLGAE
jgi:DNA polymerase-3 subunit epsilon